LHVSLRRMVRFETGLASCPTARSWRFGRWFGLRRVRCIVRRLARVSLRRRVRFETDLAYCPTARSRPFGRWLDRDGPGGMPDGSLTALRHICASTDGWIETGPAYCPTACLRRFGGWFEAGPTSCPTAHSRRFGGWLHRDGPGGLPDGSLTSLRHICASADGLTYAR